MVLAVWSDWESMNVGEAILVAIVAIFIVFLVLGIIIFVTWSMQKGMEKMKWLGIRKNKEMESTFGVGWGQSRSP